MMSRRMKCIFLGGALSLAPVWACSSSSSNTPTSAAAGSGGSTSTTTTNVSSSHHASSNASSGSVVTAGTGGSNANIGLPCMMDSDCGSPLKCSQATATDTIFGGGPANGYCSMACMQDSDCPGSGTACFMGNATTGPGECVLLCNFGPALAHINDPIATDGKCNMRDDVACGPIDTEGTVQGCLPVCGKDSQCPTGRHCDARLSVCVDTPNTGTATGTVCDPTATTPTCAGLCLSLTGADGGVAETMCSSECVLGGDTPYTSTPSCGGLTAGICLYSQQGEGAGDVGFCAPACSKQDDCQIPAFWCYAISGLTGATGGVPTASACRPRRARTARPTARC